MKPKIINENAIEKSYVSKAAYEDAKRCTELPMLEKYNNAPRTYSLSKVIVEQRIIDFVLSKYKYPTDRDLISVINFICDDLANIIDASSVYPAKTIRAILLSRFRLIDTLFNAMPIPTSDIEYLVEMIGRDF